MDILEGEFALHIKVKELKISIDELRIKLDAHDIRDDVKIRLCHWNNILKLELILGCVKFLLRQSSQLIEALGHRIYASIGFYDHHIGQAFDFLNKSTVLDAVHQRIQRLY